MPKTFFLHGTAAYPGDRHRAVTQSCRSAYWRLLPESLALRIQSDGGDGMSTDPVLVRKRLRRNVAVVRTGQVRSSNHLEIARLLVGLLTPLTVAVVGFYLSAAVSEREALDQAAQAARQRDATQFAALGQLAQATALHDARAGQFLAGLTMAAVHPPADKDDLHALRDRYYEALAKVDGAGVNFAVAVGPQGEVVGDVWTHFSRSMLIPSAGCIGGVQFLVLAEPDDKDLIERIEACAETLTDNRRQRCRQAFLNAMRAMSIGKSEKPSEEIVADVKNGCPLFADSPRFKKYFGTLP